MERTELARSLRSQPLRLSALGRGVGHTLRAGALSGLSGLPPRRSSRESSRDRHDRRRSVLAFFAPHGLAGCAAQPVGVGCGLWGEGAVEIDALARLTDARPSRRKPAVCLGFSSAPQLLNKGCERCAPHRPPRVAAARRSIAVD